MKSISKGSKIGISSPASLPDPEKLENGVKLLKFSGFDVVVGDSCYKKSSEIEKVRELRHFSNECDLIICARGGAGSYRLIDYIDKPPDKPICGYSDITSLLFLQHKHGIPSFHGPMVIEFKENKKSFDFLVELLTGNVGLPFELPMKMNPLILRTGKATGKLLAGNLSLIVTIMDQIGTDIFNDSILFVEDVDETLDSVDRMLWKLVHSIKGRTKGLIFGGFTRTKKGSENYSLIEILRYHIRYLNVPSFLGFPMYHGKFFKYTLPMGATVKMDADECSITFIGFP